MNYKKVNIKNGVNVHLLNTNKFKTNLFSVFLTVPLQRETVTKNALVTAVLRRGTKQMPTQDEISKNLENMYGASFDCGVEKTGDNHIIKFYLEGINDEYLPNNETIFNKCLEILLSIAFDPVTEKGIFLQEYVESEKQNLIQIINGKIDNKNRYAFERCVEEMYKNKPYGLYKYGYAEDLENIDAKNLYDYYINLINTAKIDVFVSGNLSEDIVQEIKNNKMINSIKERQPNYAVNKAINSNNLENEQLPKQIEEKLQINQGKLLLGLQTFNNKTSEQHINNPIRKYATSIYNIILGGSANSKLFQNVREKASLAYTASSNYIRVKDNIFIRSGIEIANYEKALNIIKEQLEQIENGDFTDEEVENAKKLVISTVSSIPDSQDAEITYYLGQELSEGFVTIDEYIANIKNVTKQDVIEVAKEITINTIYFLRN